MGNNGHHDIEGERNRKSAIFIVDNQPLYRQAIRQVLQKDMEVVGEAALTPGIWSAIERLSPDIALVDVGLPSLSGFRIARQIATHCPGVAVAMLTPSPDDDQLFQAIKSGAVAFLTKDINAEKMIATLGRVGQGQYPINEDLLSQPGAAKKLLESFRSLSLMGNNIETLLTPLSPREIGILRYIAEGNSNKRIAYSLGTAEQTIKNHITSIMRKLNANDRTHAVILAMRKGWLNIEETLDAAEQEELVTSM